MELIPKLKKLESKLRFLSLPRGESLFCVELNSQLIHNMLDSGYFKHNKKALKLMNKSFDINQLTIFLTNGMVELEFTSYYPPTGKILEEYFFTDTSNIFQLELFWEPILDKLCRDKAELIWEEKQKQKKENEIDDILNQDIYSVQLV